MLTLAAGAVLVGVLWWQVGRLGAADATPAGRIALGVGGGGGLAALALVVLLSGALLATLVAALAALAVAAPLLRPVGAILPRWSGRAIVAGSGVPRPSWRRFSSPPAG